MTRPAGPASTSNKTTSETLRPFILAAGLLALLGLAALAAYLLTAGSGHTLTVTKPAGGTLSGGGIRCGTDGADCSVSVEAGEVVELTAAPDDGFSFAGFTGDCAPVGRVLMGGPRTCGAEFAADGKTTASTFPLTITPAAGGTILSDVGHQCGGQHTTCTVNVPEGQAVKIEGYTDPGYSVAAYTGDCAPSGTTTMTQARTCSATFVQFKVADPRAQVTPPPSFPPLANQTGLDAARRPDANRPPVGPGGRDARAATPAAGGDRQTPPASATTPAQASNVPAAPTAPVSGPIVEAPPGKDGDDAHGRAIKLAQDELKKTLTAYRNAYIRMDIESMRRLYPGLDVKRHQFEFDNNKSVKYDFEGDLIVPAEEIDTATGRATYVVGVKTENTPKAGKKDKPVEWQATFTFKRIGTTANWQIETLDNRLK